MRAVLLVPRRRDYGHRDAVWDWCRERWRRWHPELTIYEGHHEEGPFNRSAAVNRAALEAGEWDIALVVDSDIFLRFDNVVSAIVSARDTGKVTWAHRRWRGITEEWTKRIVADRFEFGDVLQRAPTYRDDLDILVETTTPISWSCCVAVPRAVFDDMGGFDERFRGWGFEDMAFQSVVVGLYGHERIEGDVYHLWHPRSGERIVKGLPGSSATRDYAVNAMLGRRYMLALRRDHGLHDRPGLPVSEDERQRDIANLIADDEKVRVQMKRHNLPRWEDWWPTLEELRDGAKEYRVTSSESNPRPPTITAIVHTGGVPANWPERRGYLERALVSFDEQVSGPIVQRVIYSDWSDEFIDELHDLAARFGFYVAGEGHHGYTGSMERMWKYIGRRAQGEFIFQTEDDFLFDRPVDLTELVETLRMEPKLAQIALLRDAYYQDEKDTMGILGWPVPAFTEVSDNGHSRLEHRLFFTANPSVFRRSLTTELAWPTERQARRILGRRADQMPSSETAFGKLLFEDPRVRVAFWGSGEQWVSHIGATRAGVGY